MADSFGLLANGDFVLCCLDYEAEMRLGNIDEISVGEALASEKRAAVRRRLNQQHDQTAQQLKAGLDVVRTRGGILDHLSTIDIKGKSERTRGEEEKSGEKWEEARGRKTVRRQLTLEL